MYNDPDCKQTLHKYPGKIHTSIPVIEVLSQTNPLQGSHVLLPLIVFLKVFGGHVSKHSE